MKMRTNDFDGRQLELPGGEKLIDAGHRQKHEQSEHVAGLRVFVVS